MRRLTVLLAVLLMVVAVPAAASADVSRKSLGKKLVDRIELNLGGDMLTLDFGSWNGTNCVDGLGSMSWENRNKHCRLVGIGAVPSNNATWTVKKKHIGPATRQVQVQYNAYFADLTSYLDTGNPDGSGLYCDVGSGLPWIQRHGIGFLWEHQIERGKSSSCGGVGGREFDPMYAPSHAKVNGWLDDHLFKSN